MILTHANQRMEECLQVIRNNSLSEHIDCNICSLLDIFSSSFYEYNNCIYLNGVTPIEDVDGYNCQDESLSLNEYFGNHFHMIDLISNPSKIKKKTNILRIGLLYTQLLKDKLCEEYPQTDFVIYLYCDTRKYRDSFSIKDCVVYFHKYREEEGLVLSDDIDSISQPIGIIDTRVLRKG